MKKKSYLFVCFLLLFACCMIAFLSFQTKQLREDGLPSPTPTNFIKQEPTEVPFPTEMTRTPELPTGTPIPPSPTPVPIQDLTAKEVIFRMGNGINLGHTMDAYGRKTLGTDASVFEYETSWGQPITTKEMINGMKSSGFDTIRIPVSWTNTMNFEEGDFTINQAYLNRVEELIDYAIQAEMFVIINDHWDGGWWGMFGSAQEEIRSSAMDLYIAMWTQIATAYANKPYYLIFESGNEELGYRLNNTDVCPDSGSLSEADYYNTVNQINQTFVNTIRACGGNNKDRFLLISGVNANIASTCNNAFSLPNDEAKNKLLVSVHYYDPYSYCLFQDATTWGSIDEIYYMDYTLSKMQQFTDIGVGVVIGEWGITLAPETMKENQLLYMEKFLAFCEAYNYCPVLWDTGVYYDKVSCELVKKYQYLFQKNSDSQTFFESR